MISKQVLTKMVQAIHNTDGLYGCVIGFHGNGQSTTLHKGIPGSVAMQLGVIAIIDEVKIPRDKLPVADQPKATYEEKVRAPTVVTNNSRVGAELIGAGLSCVFFAVSAVGVFAGAAAAPVTGGASTAVSVLAWTGFLTGGAQCINGLVRAGVAIAKPDENTLQQWDANKFYEVGGLIVDGIGVVSGLAQLAKSFPKFIAALQSRGGLVSAEAFGKMDSLARKKAIQDAMKKAASTPEGKKALIDGLSEAGLSAKAITAAAAKGTKGVQKGPTILGNTNRIISAVAAKSLTAELKGIALGILQPTINAVPAKYVGSYSGSVNWVLVNLVLPKPKNTGTAI